MKWLIPMNREMQGFNIGFKAELGPANYQQHVKMVVRTIDAKIEVMLSEDEAKAIKRMIDDVIVEIDEHKAK